MKTTEIKELEDLVIWSKNYKVEVEIKHFEHYKKGVYYNIIRRKNYLKQTVEKFVINYAKERGVSKDEIWTEMFKISVGI